MDITLGYVLKALILPPGGMLLLALLGWVVAPRLPRAGRGVVISAWLALWLASTPLLAGWLTSFWSAGSPLDLSSARGAEAIAVLAGGKKRSAEYGGETVRASTLERLRYAARLHRETGLPVAVIGGRVFGDGRPEAELMREVLVRDLATPVRWVEASSRNTAENALAAWPALGVSRILLVTHALHMRRAEIAFNAAGFEVMPAPVGVGVAESGPAILEFLPSLPALNRTRAVLHEMAGVVWYRHRYGFASR